MLKYYPINGKGGNLFQRIAIIFLTLFIGGCVATIKYDVIKKVDLVQEISQLEYLPLAMSRSPLTLNVISDKDKVSEIIRIINRAEKVRIKYSVQSLGKLNNFSYTLAFTGTTISEISFIYILKNKDGTFLTDITTNFDITNSAFTLFKILSSDESRFTDLIKSNKD